MESSQTSHWVLKRTKDFMLTYRRSDSLEIFGYSDFDFAGCQDSKQCNSGYFFMLARGVISWKSAKQTLIASSTMVAEFNSLLKSLACHKEGTKFEYL